MPLNRSGARVIFLLVGILAGPLLFLVGLYSNLDSIFFHHRALRTEGRIMEVQATATKFPWGPAYTYDYSVEFNLGGKVFRAHPPNTSTRMEEGQWVPLIYDPADPVHARLADSGRDLTLNGLCFIPGLGLLIGSTIIFYRMRRGDYRDG